MSGRRSHSRVKSHHKVGGRKHMRGKGLLDWLRKAHDFIKKNKVVSKGFNALGQILPGHFGLGSKILGKASAVAGYGRRHRGGALSPAGGAMHHSHRGHLYQMRHHHLR